MGYEGSYIHQPALHKPNRARIRVSHPPHEFNRQSFPPGNGGVKRCAVIGRDSTQDDTSAGFASFNRGFNGSVFATAVVDVQDAHGFVRDRVDDGETPIYDGPDMSIELRPAPNQGGVGATLPALVLHVDFQAPSSGYGLSQYGSVEEEAGTDVTQLVSEGRRVLG